jgi:hypothetical protein
MPESNQPPKVFISYSWDDESHREWVRKFATRLRDDGIETVLDRWHAVPGDQLGDFMERVVRESDFVLCVCTPKYKEKSDQRGGGVGYEGDVMTGEVFVNRNQRKFIPVLRKDEWKNSAPSWLLGKYFIDLRGDPYSEQNYQDLLTTLQGQRETPPPIGNGSAKPIETGKPSFEFVNREIELATLDPVKLVDSYWQVALVSAPTGYGKSRLMKRLIEKIQTNAEQNQKWSCVHIDLKKCDDLDQADLFTSREVMGESITSDIKEEDLKRKLCAHILDKLSAPLNGGPLRNILFILDSIDNLTEKTGNWFDSLIHDMVLGSYRDYAKGTATFSVRVIIAGVDTESFWKNYQKWESSSNQKHRLKAPKRLPLSAFDELAIQDLTSRRAKQDGIYLNGDASDISYELQYLSGGHPQVVAEILEELVVKKFSMYKEYFNNNREELVKNYISKVVRKILNRFLLPQAQKDIKTICVFRLIDLNTLRRLKDEKLVSEQVDIKLLGQLCEYKILNQPKADKPFYHDDIVRRILYLDMVYGNERDMNHVQRTHTCAKKLNSELIATSREQHIVHYFFVEWLFHALQITGLQDNDIFLEWKSMLSLVDSDSLPLDDIKHVIEEKLKEDAEVKYLFRERFGSDDFSRLFDV